MFIVTNQYISKESIYIQSNFFERDMLGYVIAVVTLELLTSGK